MNKTTFIFLFVALFFGIMFWYFGGQDIGSYLPYYLKGAQGETAKVRIRTSLLQTEVVSTPDEMAKGLAGRKKMPLGKGMLFDPGVEGVHRITMRGMVIPIDILWISSGRIVYMADNAPPPVTGEDPALYTPSVSAQYMLETNVKFIESSGARVGDEVEILFAP